MKSRATGVASVLAALAIAGCGGDEPSGGGASRPEEAVARFLEPWSQDLKQLSRDKGRVVAFWERACDGVDPELRSKLRFNEEGGAGGERANCGAAVVLMVQYTGDTGEMRAPSRISGTPVGAETSGDESIVTVDMRYSVDSTRSRTVPAPPASARVRALVVKRGGRWYVATPRAFNPLRARDGGMSPAELRAEHDRLLDG
jgi:hypothetical protein